MNIYQSIEQYLNNRISEFKAESKRIHLVADAGTFLDSRDIEVLAKSNARGRAAQTVKNVIELHLTHNVIHATEGGKTEEEAQKEALPRVIRAIQNKLDAHLRHESAHIESVIVFNEVLSALRTEAEAV